MAVAIRLAAVRSQYDGIAPIKLRVSSWRLLVAFLIRFSISAQQALPPAIYGQVDGLAPEEMASLHEPSLSILNHGQVIFAKGYGVSDVENNVPATVARNCRHRSFRKILYSIQTYRAFVFIAFGRVAYRLSCK